MSVTRPTRGDGDDTLQHEHRREPRYTVPNKQVDVKLVSQGIVLDISNNGICVRLPDVEQLALNQRLEITLEGETHIAEIRWINDDQIRGGKIVGCEFSSPKTDPIA